jgi:4-carboxymuconolactone decarboxylase
MMDDLEKRRALGLQVIREMFGEEFHAGYKGMIESNDFGSEAGRMALEFSFAGTWGQPGLERRERSMVIISALIALGKADELKNHIRAGLNNGITVQELEAIIVQTIPYVGLVIGAEALQAASAVLKERGMDIKDAKNRGIL